MNGFMVACLIMAFWVGVAYISIHPHTFSVDPKIGEVWCDEPPEDPFDVEEPRCVTVVDIKQGYVQYSWEFDVYGETTALKNSIKMDTFHYVYDKSEVALD